MGAHSTHVCMFMGSFQIFHFVFHKRNRKLTCCAVRSHKPLWDWQKHSKSVEKHFVLCCASPNTNFFHAMPIPTCFMTAHSTASMFSIFSIKVNPTQMIIFEYLNQLLVKIGIMSSLLNIMVLILLVIKTKENFYTT